MKAAGEGINLTAANIVMMAELDWTPSLMAQCEARSRRIGQDKDVHVFYFTCEKTLDEYIWPKIEEKFSSIKKVIEGKEEVIDVNEMDEEEFEKKIQETEDVTEEGYLKVKNQRDICRQRIVCNKKKAKEWIEESESESDSEGEGRRQRKGKTKGVKKVRKIEERGQKFQDEGLDEFLRELKREEREYRGEDLSETETDQEMNDEIDEGAYMEACKMNVEKWNEFEGNKASA